MVQDRAELLSGHALFGETVSAAELPSIDLLAVDADMQRFVAESIRDANSRGERFQALIDAMIDAGLLTLDYDPGHTFTAAETFQQRRGNCLSFTGLFVALARQADLKVDFQMVRIPPIWHGDEDFVVLNNHINVVVHDIAIHGRGRRDYVVDFNTAEYDGNYPTRRVNDRYAIALYYSNVAVERLRTGEVRGAFVLLLNALEADPSVDSIWVNLGALYSQARHFELAERSYLAALDVNPDSQSALVNLARLYAHLGREEEALAYRHRVRRYQRANPYYHHWRAQVENEAGRHQESLDALDRAIALKDDEHQFYHLRSVVHYRTGDRQAAQRDLTLARDYARQQRQQAAYTAKLDVLKSR